MACACLEKANHHLDDRNTRLVERVVLPRGSSPGYSSVTLVTEKIAPRGERPLGMLATFCPFCGDRYEPVAPETEARG